MCVLEIVLALLTAQINQTAKTSVCGDLWTRTLRFALQLLYNQISTLQRLYKQIEWQEGACMVAFIEAYHLCSIIMILEF